MSASEAVDSASPKGHGGCVCVWGGMQAHSDCLGMTKERKERQTPNKKDAEAGAL